MCVRVCVCVLCVCCVCVYASVLCLHTHNYVHVHEMYSLLYKHFWYVNTDQQSSFMQVKIFVKRWWPSINCGHATSSCYLEALNVHKPMGPKILIAMGAQMVLNFLIIRMECWSKSHCYVLTVWMETMHRNIGENHMIFCRHVNHKCHMK